jgi:hypothetical protein
VTRQQEQLILRLWREWCKVWPEQYGHSSLDVKPEGYDPVFDVIPSQAYKDFYLEVVSGHPALRQLNVFEVVDVALNEIRAPEAAGNAAAAPARAADHARVVDVDIAPAGAATRPPGDQHAESA